jgi:hypothetical protein
VASQANANEAILIHGPRLTSAHYGRTAETKCVPDKLPSSGRLVPDDFSVPAGHVAGGFRLVPLGPEHNAADYAAWTSSIDHIRATPGFVRSSWPSEDVRLTQNLADLERHARDAADRTGFTYTVLSPEGVIGCVYIYPPRRAGYDAEVRSWVRASHAELDESLWRVVSAWLVADWPFRHPDYATRGNS